MERTLGLQDVRDLGRDLDMADLAKRVMEKACHPNMMYLAGDLLVEERLGPGTLGSKDELLLLEASVDLVVRRNSRHFDLAVAEEGLEKSGPCHWLGSVEERWKHSSGSCLSETALGVR